MLRAIAAVLIVAGCAFPSDTTRVRGRVLELGTNEPVPGAEVTISARPNDAGELPEGWKPGEHRQVTTDASGAFTASFEGPGSYLFGAEKSGYVFVHGSEVKEAVLTRVNPETDVCLMLARPGEIRGRVVDEDSGEAAPGLQLRLIRMDDMGLRFFEATSVPVNAAGEFRATGIAPGDYVVATGPSREASRKVQTKFTAGEVDVVDRDFAIEYWPGGRGPQDVLPLHVGSGEIVKLGRIVARRTTQYRVHVRLLGFDCAAGVRMRARLSVQDGDTVPVELECAKEWLIAGLPRGQYRLEIDAGGRDERVAVVPFTLMDKGISVDAVLAAPIVIEGEVAGAKGALASGYGELTLILRAAGSGGVASVKPPSDSQEKAGFRVTGLHAVEYTLRVLGLAGTRYVREVKYNNLAIEGDTLPLDVPALAHHLEIVIGDDPGEITGTVRGGGLVVARRSPRGLDRYASIGADTSGLFRLTGLAPGEYRVIAVKNYSAARKEAIERALAGGVKVEVAPHGTASVTLEAIEAR